MNNQQGMPDPVEPAFNTAGAMIASGKAVQAVQTPYVTAVAVQKPRDLIQIQRACLAEAALAGDDFFYRWEVTTTDKAGNEKKSFIEGPSIELALSAVRNFGNDAVLQRPLQETVASWIFTSAFVDFETGFTLERQFRMDKSYQVYGRMDKYRKDDIRFQIGQSKSMRNVVLNAMPAGLISRMIDAAKNSVRSTIEEKVKAAGGEISKVIEPMLKSFTPFGVTKELLEEKIGLPVEQWDIEILVLLSGDYKALKKGNETRESLYGKSGEPAQPQNGGTGPADLQSKVTAAADKAKASGAVNPQKVDTPPAPSAPAEGEASPDAPPPTLPLEIEKTAAPEVDEAAKRRTDLIDEIETFIEANKLMLPIGIGNKYNRQSMTPMDFDALVGIKDQLKVWAQPKAKPEQAATNTRPKRKF